MKYTASQLIDSVVKQGALPTRLYKYRALDQSNVERTVAILRDSSFWFSQAKTFNDPFDCNLSEIHHHDIQDIQNYFDKTSIRPDVQENLLAQERTNPGIIRQISLDARKTTINKRGILSLSKNYDNILMWSHYASNHNGVVIGLDLLKSPDFFEIPKNVNYRDEYEPLNYFSNQQDAVDRNISTKSSLWSYEEEVRILKPNFGSHEISRDAIVSMHFGCKTSDSAISDIKAVCNEMGNSNARFYKAHMAYGAFKLDFDEID